MNNSHYRILAVLVVASACAVGGELAGWRFKSAEANEAVEHYQVGVAEADSEAERLRVKLDSSHHAAMAELNAELLANLEAAKERAMLAKNLKEAVALDKAIDELKERRDVGGADEPAANPAIEREAADGFVESPTGALTAKLIGTRWMLAHGGWVEFLADNKIRVSTHKEGGIWAAVDGRTIRFTPHVKSRSIVEWHLNDKGQMVDAKAGRILPQLPN